MALNNFKRNHLIPLQFEGLNLIHFRNARSVHCNLISMAFQDHVFKCRFGKIANLKSTAMNNCHERKTCSTQMHTYSVSLLLHDATRLARSWEL